MRSILLYALPILGLVSSQALVSDAIFAQPNVNSRMKPITTPQEFIIQSDEDQPSQSLPGVTPRAVVPVQTFDVTVIDTPNVNGQSTQFSIWKIFG